MHIADIGGGHARRQRHRRRRHAAGAWARRCARSCAAPARWRSPSSATARSGQGVVHECLNMAAIWKLPVIFVCENNRYAESTPVEYAISSRDLARGRAATACRRQRRRQGRVRGLRGGGRGGRAGAAGEGPTLLECKTYRYYGHYFGDDPLRYRHGRGGGLLPRRATASALRAKRWPTRACCSRATWTHRRRGAGDLEDAGAIRRGEPACPT